MEQITNNNPPQPVDVLNHDFVRYKNTPYCAVRIEFGARCGLRQEAHQPVDVAGVPERTAMDKFRNSVGFQFMFVLHSGLEVERAVDHVCAAAERLIEARATQPATTPELLSVIQNAQAVLAMILHSGDSQIPKDLMRSGESALAECTAALFGRSAS